MKNIGYIGRLCGVLATVLLCPIALIADSIIVSVTAPPALSTLISNHRSVSTSWSASRSYTDVTIAVLVDSAGVGQTETGMGEAYLTARLGPGTTPSDQIASAPFVVPAQLPVCSHASCGANVSLFSGLSLSPGTYFLTLGPDLTNPSAAAPGWFPALNPNVVVEDTGASLGASFFSEPPAAYVPASPLALYNHAMNFTVTGTPTTTPTPEPVTASLLGAGGLVLLFLKRRTAC